MKNGSQEKRTGVFEKCKNAIKRRLEKKQFEDQPKPIMTGQNIDYEMGEKTRAMNYGGIGAIHKMVKQIGLDQEIDNRLDLLKVHVPYHESDHVLNLTYNALVGGVRLEDIELRRNDEVFMDAIGAQRIPDPTTAGDFTRRFERKDNVLLMDAINAARERVWSKAPRGLMKEAIIDVDGTLAGTLGQCKQGMDISYKGIWGYHPLILSLANTNEVLYLVNRPGNVASHEGAAEWMDKAIDLVAPHCERILLRGDTDFSLTKHFDRWSARVDFVFGMDASKGRVARAEALEEACWAPLQRPPKYEVRTQGRKRPKNIKEQIVIERNFDNIRLNSEQVAEFEYRPGKCTQSYRMVVVRKNLSIEKGERVRFDEIRYFFYITTRRDLTADEVVGHANKRCNQENVIAQLKNGVNAMRMPVRDLNSNWAYMIMAALAWNLKAWFGMLMPNRIRCAQVLKMEFRRFLQMFILIPCQIVLTGRKIVYRILGYNEGLKDFFDTFERIKRLQFE
ncbi:MAG: IS1380 family transposase [Candidatus Promineifilaceae bacterium]